LIAQNNDPKTERRGNRVFKKTDNFPFPLLDKEYQFDKEIIIAQVNANIPVFANSAANQLLKIILNSPDTYDDFISLNLTKKDAFGIKNQFMVLEQFLKVDYNDPNTKLEPIDRKVSDTARITYLTVTFKQGLKPGATGGNVSFNFNKEGCYLQMFYMDDKNTETLKKIFGEEKGNQIIQRVMQERMRRIYLTPEEQQILAQKISTLK